MPSVRKIHHWTETVSCRDENMPQDHFSGYINTEEAADCAVCSCAVCRLRRYERWMISGLSLRLRWARPSTRHRATHPHPQSQECEILEREVREASLNLKALSFDATSPKSPTNYQLTTVGWLPSNVVAARGQNTFVSWSKINNLDLRYFQSCGYCVWCGRLIWSPNVQIYPRIKQHLRPIMPGPGQLGRNTKNWIKMSPLFLRICAVICCSPLELETKVHPLRRFVITEKAPTRAFS